MFFWLFDIKTLLGSQCIFQEPTQIILCGPQGQITLKPVNMNKQVSKYRLLLQNMHCLSKRECFLTYFIYVLFSLLLLCFSPAVRFIARVVKCPKIYYHYHYYYYYYTTTTTCGICLKFCLPLNSCQFRTLPHLTISFHNVSLCFSE